MDRILHLAGNAHEPTNPELVQRYRTINPTYDIKFHVANTPLPATHEDIIRQFKSKSGRAYTLANEKGLRRDLLKLHILNIYGGWWFHNWLTYEELNLDVLYQKYCSNDDRMLHICKNVTTISLYIPLNFSLWKNIKGYLEFMKARPLPAHPVFIYNMCYHLQSIFPNKVVIVDSGEVSIDDYVRKSMEKSKDQMSYNSSKNSPEVIALIKRYMAAHDRWDAAGRPMRSKEQMEDIFKICKECEHIKWDLLGYKCNICKCRLHHKREKINKIAMATESCPDDPPRWKAEV